MPDSLEPLEKPLGAPESITLQSKCVICHTIEYVTQQRLSEPQWKKTIEKMRKFGAPVTADEVASLTSFAARYFRPDLPLLTLVPASPPSGAMPLGQ